MKGYFQETVSRAYLLYQNLLNQAQALDFDDLILKTVKLFEKEPSVLEKYQNCFQHVMVDEYHDTNHAQYMILKELSKQNNNLFVVGDDDQSIYGFRGADINNILDFEEDFPNCKIYKLERNYRSTQRILRSASFLVRNNKQRKGKILWTKGEEGAKLTLFNSYDENSEAHNLVRFIKKELLYKYETRR